MSRQSSQGTRMYVETAEGTALDIVSATAAKPCVLTFQSAPAALAPGDIIRIKGSGWASLDERPYVVASVLTTTVTLQDSDTTKENVADFVGANANAHELTFAEFCMASLTFSSPAGAIINVTTLCDNVPVTVSGLPAVSTWNAAGFWDSGDVIQTTLREMYRSGVYKAFKALFQDNSGLLYNGNVNQFDVSAGIDQAVAITVGGAVSGGYGLIPKPAA